LKPIDVKINENGQLDKNALKKRGLSNEDVEVMVEMALKVIDDVKTEAKVSFNEYLLEWGEGLRAKHKKSSNRNSESSQKSEQEEDVVYEDEVYEDEDEVYEDQENEDCFDEEEEI
jgi:hypothetical protein